MRNKIAYFYLIFGLLIFSGCSPESTDPSEITDSDTADATEEVVEEKAEKPEVTEEKPVEEKKSEEVAENKETPKKAAPALQKMIAHYIDVGQAEATLLQFSDAEDAYTMLIDTGNWNKTDVVSYLQKENVSSIDIIAITHPHADHIGQLDKIINTFDVSEVWMNGETTDSAVFLRALVAIENNDVDFYEPEVGDVFDVGPLEIEVLHPLNLSGGTNDNSIAMRLQYGAISFLFTGDGEKKAESALGNFGSKLKATILQLGHHGSNTSTSNAFLQAVNPEVAIYSAGANNQYGHPNREVIERVQANNTLLYGTDIHGTIRIETDGVKYTVQTHKQGTIPAKAAAPPKEKKSEKVAVEKKVEKTAKPPAKPPATTGGNCVNINEASEAEVQRIKHIGEARAKLLIASRPYNSIDELTKISGIGPARIKDIIAQNIACTGG